MNNSRVRKGARLFAVAVAAVTMFAFVASAAWAAVPLFEENFSYSAPSEDNAGTSD